MSFSQNIESLLVTIAGQQFNNLGLRLNQSHQLNQISNHIQALDNMLQEHTSLQEAQLNQAITLTQGNVSFTPRFMLIGEIPPTTTEYEYCNQLLRQLTSRITNLIDAEQAIIGYYKEYVDQIQHDDDRLIGDDDFQERYHQEKQKNEQLTKRIQGISDQYYVLQEKCEELMAGKDDYCPNCDNYISVIDDYRDKNKRLVAEINEICQNHDELQRKFSELENKTGNRQTEIVQDKELLALKQINQNLEAANGDLIRRLEIAEDQLQKMDITLEEYDQEAEIKESTLQKAQFLIKKLNAECEKLVNDLAQSQDLIEHLKKDNRQLEKQCNGLQVQQQELKVYSQTEERLREQIAQLKQKVQMLQIQIQDQYQELSNRIEILLEEKGELEAIVYDLEDKLQQIDAYNEERDQLLQQSEENNSELNFIIEQKEQQINDLEQEMKNQLLEKDEESEFFKRQSENLIRHIKNFNQQQPSKAQKYVQMQNKPGDSNKENRPMTEYDKVNAGLSALSNTVLSPQSMYNLQEQLNLALEREAKLKNDIIRIVNQEAQVIKDNLKKIEQQQSYLKPEIERWIMRNEELEQRLLGLMEKNSQLIRANQDIRKFISAKDVQLLNQSEASKIMSQDFESIIQYLKEQIYERDQLIQEQILPFSQNLIDKMLSECHEEISQIRNKKKQLKGKLLQQNEQICQLQSEKDNLEHNYSVLNDELVRNRNDLYHINKFVREESFQTPNEESDYQQISDYCRNILDRILQLQDYRKKLNYLEEDFQYQQNQQEILQRNNQHLQQEIDQLQSQLEQMTKSSQDHKQSVQQLQGTMQREADMHKIQVKELNNQLEQARQFESQLQNLKEKLEQEFTMNEQTKIEYYKDISDLEQKLVQRQSEVERLEKELKRVQGLLQEAYSQMDQVQGKYQNIDQQKTKNLNDLQTIIDHKDSTIQQLRKELQYELRLRTSHNIDQDYDKMKLSIDLLEKQNWQLEQSNKQYEQMLSQKSNVLPQQIHQLEQLIQHKNQIIANLESELQHGKFFPDTVRQSVQTERESELQRLIRKKESDKRSFQKRVREFELILRFLDEKICTIGEKEYKAQCYQDKMNELMGQLAQKNPTLYNWLKELCHTLEDKQSLLLTTLDREKSFYKRLLENQMSQSPLSATKQQIQLLINQLMQSGSKQITILSQQIFDIISQNHEQSNFQGVLQYVSELAQDLEIWKLHIENFSNKLEHITYKIGVRNQQYTNEQIAETLRLLQNFMQTHRNQISCDYQKLVGLQSGIQEFIHSNNSSLHLSSLNRSSLQIRQDQQEGVEKIMKQLDNVL